MSGRNATPTGYGTFHDAKYAAKKHFMYALKLDGQGGFIS
jgi:hypothetical protein